MKTDMQLHQDVLAELTWDPSIHEKEIGVAVKDGVVTLTGVVESYPEKWAAERVAGRVAGARAIVNDLEVSLPALATRSDTDIAHRVVDALEWDIQVPTENIKTKITNGWVTLEGEVEWKYQKDAAERAVTFLSGVRGVSNNITLKPTAVSAFDVSRSIKEALRRRAESEAEKIIITTAEGTVTLKGTVDSFADRRAAEGAAWSAPGVRDVHDEIVVSV